MTTRRRAVERIVGVVVFGFVAAAALELTRRWAEGDLTLDAGWTAASIASLALGYLALAWGFARLMRGATVAAPSRWVCSELYFRSLLARYLPGKVGIPAVRMAGAASVGASPAFMAAGVVLESLSWLATGGLLIVLLTFGPWSAPELRALSSGPWASVLIAGVVVTVIALTTIAVRRYPARLLGLLRVEQKSGPLLPFALVLASAGLWGATALSCGCLAYALGGNDDSAMLAATAGVIAPLVGFLALPVPAGLGVREAVLVMALAPTLGTSKALGFGLVSRAIALGVEVALWLLCRILRDASGRQRTRS